jgi:Nif-specific regulatory protein
MSSRRTSSAAVSAERSRLLADNDRLRRLLRDRHRDDDLAGDSRPMCRVRELIAQVAPSPRSVCLRGERGSGKTRAARALHAGSPRAAGPFVSITCSAMSESEIDVQLFGPLGGEPSLGGGAIAGCVGRAVGGTLFLDEITDLGPTAQSRLASLTRERVWERPDGVRIPADVRIVAASRRDVDALVVSGGFRRDLWEHLRAFTIPVPPLRERRADLPLLADLFLERVALQFGRRASRLSWRAMDMLMSYDWPGNVGELRRTIERAVMLTNDPVVHHHHLPAEIQDVGRRRTPTLGLNDALEAYEKELLDDALKETRGVRSRAARLLMTSERVLGYRLRKHGIDSRRYKTPS